MTKTHTIAHRIEVEAPIERLFAALAQPTGIAAWWTPMVEPGGSASVGTVLKIRFGDGQHGPDMRIDTLDEADKVQWTCIEGPWKGQQFIFEISEHDRGSLLRFYHTGWPEQSDFYMHCNAKWGYFLAVSLKKYLETGQGAPHPEDPSI